MAIFSSSKKSKKESVAAHPQQHPSSTHQLASSLPNSSSNPQPLNGSFTSTQSNPNIREDFNHTTASTSAHDLHSTAHRATQPSAAASQSTQSPNPAHTVLYPWAQRKFALQPALLLPPIDPLNPTQIPQPIAGPISAPPFPRYGHSVNPVASAQTGHLYIFGGLVQNQVRNDLYQISCAPAAGQRGETPTGNSSPLSVGLVETRGEIPGQRVGHASVGVGNVLIVWGGDTKSRPEDVQDDGLYLLNLSTKEWTRVKTIGPNPEGRYGHSAAMVGSKFFVFGGQKDDGGFMNDLVWFDLQKLKAGQPKWSFVDYNLNAVVPPKRTGHTTVTFGDSIYVFGGTDGQYHYNDTWAYDTNTGIWTELSCIGYIPVPREGHAATLVDDVMYVFGGRGVDGKDLEDLAAFKISNQRWFMFQNMGPAPSGRSGHAMATYQNKVFVLGGESYTSQRADDPSFVHVLDTSKIKYPADSQRRETQQITRKSSIPAIAAQQNPATRATSPTQRTTAPGSPSSAALNSFGQTIAQTNPNSHSSQIRSISPPPIRPARPGDEQVRRTQEMTSSPKSPDRAMSPNTRQNRVHSPPASEIAGSAAPRSRFNGTSPPIAQTAAAFTQTSRAAGTTSPSGDHETNLAPAIPSVANAAPRDGFYYPANRANSSPRSPEAGKSHAEELEKLRAQQGWYKAMLAQAKEKGFLPENEAENPQWNELETSNSADPNSVKILLDLRKELVQAQNDLNLRAEQIDDRMNDVNAARTAALQEASYYRAKLAAWESGQSHEANKLEQKRIHALESKLTESITNYKKLAMDENQMEIQLKQISAQRAKLEQDLAAAHSRAETAENSHAQALNEFNEVSKRAYGHESTIADHSERLNSLNREHSALTSENSDLKQNLESHQTSVAQHLRVIEETQFALSAAHTRNDEVHNLWQTASKELSASQIRATELETELQASKTQNSALTAKINELEQMLDSARETHRATQILATGGLAELLANKSEPKIVRMATRDGAEGDEGEHAQKLRQLSQEHDSVKEMYQQLRSQANSSAEELLAAREREANLHTQLNQLRQELSAIQAQHYQTSSRAHEHESNLAAKQAQLTELERAKESAEIQANLLRNLLSDHGLSATEDELATRYPPMSGNESSQILFRRVQELESRLEQTKRSHENHVTELNRAREAETSTTNQDRQQAEQLQSEYAQLQSRHEQLEATHLKAVSYVKGTEKMLRRMKDELTRYKEKCAELERPDREMLPHHQAELDTLKQQFAALKLSSDTAAGHQAELERKLATLQIEHQTRSTESEEKVQALNKEIQRLDSDLDRAQIELQETLAVNASLNSELTAAMKNSTNPRGISNSPADGISKLTAELNQATNKAEWLKRENAQLEERCRTAESKITILLNHLEQVDPEESENSPNSHEANFEKQAWNQNQRANSDGGSDYSVDEAQNAFRRQ